MASEEAARLQEQIVSKFNAIAEHIANELGFGALQGMTPEKRSELDQEVQDAIDKWSEGPDLDMAQPTTPLQHLLAEHRLAEDAILDYRDARLDDDLARDLDKE